MFLRGKEIQQIKDSGILIVNLVEKFKIENDFYPEKLDDVKIDYSYNENFYKLKESDISYFRTKDYFYLNINNDIFYSEYLSYKTDCNCFILTDD